MNKKKIQLIAAKCGVALAASGALIVAGCSNQKKAANQKSEPDRQQIQQRIDEIDKVLNPNEMRVIYGPPEMFERLARERQEMEHERDSLQKILDNQPVK